MNAKLIMSDSSVSLDEYLQILNSEVSQDSQDRLFTTIGNLSKNMRLAGYQAMLNSEVLKSLGRHQLCHVLTQVIYYLPEDMLCEGYKLMLNSEALKGLDAYNSSCVLIGWLKGLPEESRLLGLQSMLLSEVLQKMDDDNYCHTLVPVMHSIPRGRDVLLSVEEERLTLYAVKGAVNPNWGVVFQFNQKSGYLGMIGACTKRWIDGGVEGLIERYHGPTTYLPDQCSRIALAFSLAVKEAKKQGVVLPDQMEIDLNKKALDRLQSKSKENAAPDFSVITHILSTVPT